ncbi:MAG: phage tail protein [Oligoflexia bacterium]|nr:phage tail protein [Oligoflexia bacterium]
MIEVSFDTAKLKDLLQAKAVTVIKKASVHAINTTMISLRTRVKKRLSDELGLKQKDISKRLNVVKATQTRAVGTLRIFDKGFPLVQFTPRKVTIQTSRGPRKGVSVLIGGVRQVVPTGFLITLKSGKKGIFERVGNERLPIRQLFSSALEEQLKKGSLLTELNDYMLDGFRKNFERDFEFYSKREGVRATGPSSA